LAQADVRVQQLQSIPGVGPRLAEVIVAVIDDPNRFKNAKQVGAYAGLTPTQFESGTMSRQGGISGRGNKLLRALLVQVSWLARRYNGKISAIFEEVCRGNKTRRKIAVIATELVRRTIAQLEAFREPLRWQAEATAAVTALGSIVSRLRRQMGKGRRARVVSPRQWGDKKGRLRAFSRGLVAG
jgi:hypothetical protein